MHIDFSNVSLEEARDETLDEASEWKDRWETMVKSDAWKRFVYITQCKAKISQRAANTPSASIDEMVSKEFVKGEVNALAAILLIPYQEVERLNEIIEREST